MKIATIIGARPQFVKAAVVSKAIIEKRGVQEVLIHTGQHYDANMSDVFFQELGIPEPSHNLNVGGGSHGHQTGRMMVALEDVIQVEKPDAVLVYGDTNSTLAGALVAAKLHIPIAHVEAGLRSFNRRMPEEVNRVLTDHISTWLFCPTGQAEVHLNNEGIQRGVYNVGDVMYDGHLLFSELARQRSSILADLSLNLGKYFLATIHRPENTNDPRRLEQIFAALALLDLPVILPLHPRTRNVLKTENIQLSDSISVIEPVSYLDMVLLQKNAAMILTDSGGIQKEAYFCQIPCVTLRDETEWIELVEHGWNRVVGADTERILAAVKEFKQLQPQRSGRLYGSGRAAHDIVEIMHTQLGEVS